MPYWRLFYHVIWGTKGKLALIEPEWQKDLYGYLWGKATALECLPHAIGGMPDHIHIAISIPPKLSVATLVGQLKGASSHHINDIHPGGTFAWQAEYGVLSFSEKSLPAIVAYINNQERHHAENDLQAAMETMDL